MLFPDETSNERHFFPTSGRVTVHIIFLAGGHVFLNQRHNFFFIFRNRYTGILAETVQKNYGVKNLTARYTMPTPKNVILPVEFLKSHPPATTLANDSIPTAI